MQTSGDLVVVVVGPPLQAAAAAVEAAKRLWGDACWAPPQPQAQSQAQCQQPLVQQLLHEPQFFDLYGDEGDLVDAAPAAGHADPPPELEQPRGLPAQDATAAQAAEAEAAEAAQRPRQVSGSRWGRRRVSSTSPPRKRGPP